MMAKPSRKSANTYKHALAAFTLPLIVAGGLVSQTYAQTAMRCDAISDFEAEFERVFSSDPNVIAKCEAYHTVRFADPFGPFPLGGTANFETGPYVFLSDKIEVVNGIAYLRRYTPWGGDCGDIENPPSHVLLDGMTCRFK